METDLTRDVLPLTEFREKLARLVEELGRGQRPLVVTRNGRPAAVLLAPEAYEQLRYRAYVQAKAAAGLADMARGRTAPQGEVLRRARARLDRRRRA